MNTEAFEKAKAAYGTGAYDDATLEFLFPQLKESEDEKTRKDIRDFILNRVGYLLDENTEHRFIAYLEKLREQIPHTDFVIKPHKGDDNNPYDMRVSEAQEYAIKRGFGVPFNDGEVYVDERHLTQTIGNILRWADEHPKEQKPAHTAKEMWKEMRLEVYAQASGNRHEPNYSDDSTKMFSLCDIDEIFEKIGNSPVGSQPVEWSGVDDLRLHQTIDVCDRNGYPVLSKWLKGLPRRVTPQSSWKPSEGLEEAFEKEFAKFSNDPDAGNYAFPIDLSDYKDFARHFYELGLNARKENKE